MTRPGGVSSGFIYDSVVGHAESPINLDSLSIYLKVAAGSPPIDFRNVVVHLIYRNEDLMFHEWPVIMNNKFLVSLEKGVSPLSSSFGTRHIIGQGDLVKVMLNNDANGPIDIANLRDVTLEIVPAMGQPCLIQFKTPEIFESGKMVVLA